MNKSPYALEKFVEINRAYLVLSNNATKKAYDKEYDLHFNRLLRLAINRGMGYFIMPGKYQLASDRWELAKRMIKLTGFAGVFIMVYLVIAVLYFYTWICLHEGIRNGDFGFVLLSILLGTFAIAGSYLPRKLNDVASQPPATEDKNLIRGARKPHLLN